MLSAFAKNIVAFSRTRNLIEEGARVLVALSGGPDSCALLGALCEAAEAGILPRPIVVAHFHHGLRGQDADDDAAYSAALASRYGIPCVIGLGAVRADGRSPNDAARRARYAFLLDTAQEFGADYIATAHTADDQAETVLGRILRGTSVDGLAGIPVSRPLTDRVRVVRPLLGSRRAEIEAYCTAQGMTPRRDPSNEKDRYTRSRLRKRLPELARDFNPRLPEALNRLAENAAADAALLQQLADELRTNALRDATDQALRFDSAVLQKAPPALRRRVLLSALRQLAGDTPEAEETATAERVRELEELLETGRIPNDLPGNLRARRDGNALCLERLSSPKDAPEYDYGLPVPGTIMLPESGMTLTAAYLPTEAELVRVRYSPVADLALPQEISLRVRNARPGDRIAPLGMNGRTRLIRDLMADAKWPLSRRTSAPVVYRADTGEILWIPELAQAESTRITSQTARVVRLVQTTVTDTD